MSEVKHDPVNHPSHYTDGKIEVIDFIEDKKLGFNLGNTVKYISRAGKKGSADPKAFNDPDAILKAKRKHLEDLQKAGWYLNREISNLSDECIQIGLSIEKEKKK